jgi:hypothetical protein
MHIAIPSMGRPTKVRSTRILPDAWVYVPEGEVEAYERAGTQRVVGVPGEVRGITRTRNWILDHAEDPWVVMIDDDVKCAGWVELQREKAVHKPVADWGAEFLRLFEVTQDFGFRIWGIATQSAPRSVYPWKPILFASYVTASCMGLRNETGIRFDESYPVKEDYEIGLRCVVEDGGVLAARYLYWENHHWRDEGGCKTYRTGEMEAECIDRLVRTYGRFIRRVQRNGTDYSIELDF